jgi:hypothetical protein
MYRFRYPDNARSPSFRADPRQVELLQHRVRVVAETLELVQLACRRIATLDPSQTSPDQYGACLAAFRGAWRPFRKGFPTLSALLKP